VCLAGFLFSLVGIGVSVSNMKKIKLKLDAVIFDMDGVITNTMPDHFRAWKKIFAKYGIHATRLDVYKREGQRGINSVREIFKEHGKTLDDRSATEILKEKEKLFKRIVKTRFIVGARNFLNFLERRGFTLALVTGTARHELLKILPKNIYKMFSVIVTGSDVQNGKPHPEPYLKAIKKLGVAPKRAIVIENAPFGITSARAAGLKCFALQTSLPKEYLLKASRIFLSVSDLRRNIELVKS